MSSLAQLDQKIAFLQAHRDFISQFKTLNPEPTLIKEFGDDNLERLITYHSLSTTGDEQILYLRHKPISRCPISEVLNIEIEKELKKHPSLAYKVVKIRWFLFHHSERNPYVPPFIPKRLYSGIFLEQTPKGLIAGFDEISKAGWFVYQENPIQVIPLTTKNLESVIAFLKSHAGL